MFQENKLMETISIIVPTRKRPHNLVKLRESLERTASVMPEVVLYLDEDDNTKDEAKTLGFKYVIGPRRRLSFCYNLATETASGSIVMFGADDIVFKEMNWDDKIKSEFDKSSDKILFVYGGDGGRQDDLGTHGFLHRNWINAVGYLLPPYFASYYTDNWITDVSKAIHRNVYLRCVIAEHMHYTFGKSSVDQTYNDATRNCSVDAQTWHITAHLREQDAEKLRRVMHD
jgi:glycosyltransferase involved in cell wall biosynthesis